MNGMRLVAWAALGGLLGACGGGSGDSDAGAGGAGGGSSGGAVLGDVGAGDAAGGAAAGGEAAGGAAAGGEMPPAPVETPIEARCPDAQLGRYLLVGFPDRVDAYRQREFGASYFCKFLDLGGNGLTEVSDFARGGEPGSPFFAVTTREGRGEVHSFNPDGQYVGRTESNINLAGISRLWPKPGGGGFIAWARANSNLYEISSEGRFVGPWNPPGWQGALVRDLTNMLFIRQDAAIATFTSGPPRVFINPFSIVLPAEQIGAANAIAGVDTPEGKKLLITGEVDGAGNGFGVALYKPVISQQAPPERESVLVAPGEIKDGISILPLSSGFIVLDSAVGGAPSITSFNGEGALQEQIGLDGAGSPNRMVFEQVFPSF